MQATVDDRRSAYRAMKEHLKGCAACKDAYQHCDVSRFCPRGRALWAAFRDAWSPAAREIGT
jgi:hypothetical protein